MYANYDNLVKAEVPFDVAYQIIFSLRRSISHLIDEIWHSNFVYT